MFDLAAIAVVAKDKMTIKEESKTFNKAWNHPNEESQRKYNEILKTFVK